MKQLSYLSNNVTRNCRTHSRGILFVALPTVFVVLFLAILPTSGSDGMEPVLPSGLSFLEKQEEYLLVSGTDGQGICSATGSPIIAAKFDQISYVGEHLFAVAKHREDGSSAWWLLDDKGKTVAKLPDWTRADDRRFQEGLLNIGDSYSPTAFINKLGKLAPNFDKYTDVKEFSCGLASASYSNREGRWSGYINHQGKMVIGPFKDGELSKFENGLAVVSSYPPVGKPRYGVVSSTGKFVVPMKLDTASHIGYGKFWAAQNGQIMVLDSSGKVFIKFPKNCTSVALPDKFDKGTWIACGFGGTFNNSTKWGYCDITGKIVMTPRFPMCFSFIGNRAVACAKRAGGALASGVIDRKGKWLVEPKYAGVVIIDEAHWTLDKELPADGKFVSAGSKRAVVFEELLHVHDFIGMPLSKLEEVLGKLESPPYLEQSTKIGVKCATFSLTPGAMCGTGSSTLQFAFDSNDKITGWRVMGGGYIAHSQPWITENVVAENDDRGLELGNLTPKP